MKRVALQNKNLSVWYLSGLFALIAASAPWGNEYLVNFIFVKTYMAGIMTAGLFAFWAWRMRHDLHFEFDFNPTKLLFGALFLLGLLSALWSNDIDSSLSKWMIWLMIFFSFYLASKVDLAYQNLVKFALGFLLAGSIIAVIGIAQFLFDFSALTQVASPASTFGNKNMAAQTIVMLFPLPFFLILSAQIRNKIIWWVAISAALMAVYLFYTATRAAWLGVIVESLLIGGYLVLNRKNLTQWIDWNKTKRNAMIAAGIVFLILINFTSEGFVPFWQTAFGNLGSVVDSAINTEGAGQSARYKIWAVALTMFQDSPFFGSGLGTFYFNESNLGYATYQIRSTAHVHNDIFELAVELGALGLILLSSAVVLTIVSVIHVVRQSPSKEAWFYYVLFSALAGSFVNMQFSFPYQLPIVPILFGFYIALILKADSRYKDSIKRVKFKLSRMQKNAVVGASFALSLMAIIIHLGWVSDYKVIDNMGRQVAQKRFEGFSMDAPVRYFGLQNSLHYAGKFFQDKKEYKALKIVDLQILDYWPTDFKAMSRLVFVLIRQKKFDEALRYAKKLQAITPKGVYIGMTLEADIYALTAQNKLLLQTIGRFVEVIGKNPPLQSTTYERLISRALDLKHLKYTALIYDKYQSQFEVGCDIGIKMTKLYFKHDANKAKHYLDQVLARKHTCDEASKQYLKNKGVTF